MSEMAPIVQRAEGTGIALAASGGVAIVNQQIKGFTAAEVKRAYQCSWRVSAGKDQRAEPNARYQHGGA